MEYYNVIIDSLIDTARLIPFLFAVHLLINFLEVRKTGKIKRGILQSRFAPLFGTGLALLPQCGFSVIASERYSERKITAGTLIAVFVATSDEAIPVFLASGEKFYLIFPLLLTKFVIAVIMGYLFDLIFKKANAPLPVHADNQNQPSEDEHELVHCGCGCHAHEHEHSGENVSEKHTKLHEHLIHPLTHSLKTFAVVLVLNIAFGFLVYFVTEERLSAFLQANAYFSPILAAVCGLIPNCAASVIVSDLYLAGRIPFGACLSGLTVNAGLGLTFLIKNEKSLKNKLLITFYLIIGALLFGYIACLITGF